MSVAFGRNALHIEKNFIAFHHVRRRQVQASSDVAPEMYSDSWQVDTFVEDHCRLRQPCSTYLSFSAAYSGSEDEVEAPRFNTRKNAKWDVQRVYMRMNTHKPKQLQVFQQISCELALYGFHTRDDIGEYIMIAFLQCRSATEVKTTGASLIHKWAP